MSATTWLRALFGYQVLTQGGQPVPSRAYLELPAGTLADDPLNQRTIYAPPGPSSITPLVGASLSLGPGAPPTYSATAQPSVYTNDASTVNLLGAPIPLGAAGTSTKLKITVQASMITQGPNVAYDSVGVFKFLSGAFVWSNSIGAESNIALPFSTAASLSLSVTGATNNGAGLVRLAVVSTGGLSAGQTITVAGVGGVVVANGQHIIGSVVDATRIDLRGSTFSGTYTGGGSATPNGCVGVSFPSGNLQVQATGISAAPWIANESVLALALRQSPGGLYIYSGAGVTASSGTGPTGTASGSADGTATACYVGLGPGVTIRWTAVVEVWTG